MISFVLQKSNLFYATIYKAISCTLMVRSEKFTDLHINWIAQSRGAENLIPWGKFLKQIPKSRFLPNINSSLLTEFLWFPDTLGQVWWWTSIPKFSLPPNFSSFNAIFTRPTYYSISFVIYVFVKISSKVIWNIFWN